MWIPLGLGAILGSHKVWSSGDCHPLSTTQYNVTIESNNAVWLKFL